MALHDVIKEARLKRNLKQEDAAKMVGVTVQTYGKWESGKTEPKASQAALLSEILKISTNSICNGKEDEKMDMVEFIRKASNLSHNVSGFDLTMTVWECINNDHKYLNMLQELNDDYNLIPKPKRDEMERHNNLIRDQEEKEIEQQRMVESK
jgi:transcriptional regulator with XRE-family HTH domain